MPIQQRWKNALTRRLQVTEEQAEALINAGLQTVKKVRAASEAQLEKAGIPNGKIEGK